MASIKTKFRPSAANGREGSIYYQVIHGRIIRQVKTDYRIFDSEWDKRTSSVKILPEICENRKRYLREVAEHIDWDTRRLKAIVVQCDRQGGIYSADSIVEKFNGQTGEQSLFGFMQGIIGQLKQLGKVHTATSLCMTERHGSLILCSAMNLEDEHTGKTQITQYGEDNEGLSFIISQYSQGIDL